MGQSADPTAAVRSDSLLWDFLLLPHRAPFPSPSASAYRHPALHAKNCHTRPDPVSRRQTGDLQVFVGERRYDLALRFADWARNSPDAIAALTRATPSKARIPLSGSASLSGRTRSPTAK